MGKQYRDEVAMVCHDMMLAAHSVGGITDDELKEFEEDCFIEEPEEVCEIEKSPEMANVNV